MIIGIDTSCYTTSLAAERLINSGADGSDVAKKVFHCIANSLLQVTMEAVRLFRVRQVLLVGGVASNQIMLTVEGGMKGIEFIFGAKELSSDNGVGVGLIGFDFYRKEKANE